MLLRLQLLRPVAAATALAIGAHARPGTSDAANDAANDNRVWKFGYGSNMSQEFLRTKKLLEPLDSKRMVLRGFELSFPEGRGIDYVEPAFATLKRSVDGEVHGVACLLSREDADKLNQQEGSYAIEVCRARVYDSDEEMAVEVYVPKKPLPLDHPEGVCSARYRDVLVKGAVENSLAASWVAKLKALPVYTPSAATLAMRAALPSPSALPVMSISDLRGFDGGSDERPCHVSACGYIFKHQPIFAVYRGRDITGRNLMHVRGVNLERNDDGGSSPFPRLSKMAPHELEYCLQNRDRLMLKSGSPVAVLREFWEEQDAELAGVYRDNTRSLT